MPEARNPWNSHLCEPRNIMTTFFFFLNKLGSPRLLLLATISFLEMLFFAEISQGGLAANEAEGMQRLLLIQTPRPGQPPLPPLPTCSPSHTSPEAFRIPAVLVPTTFFPPLCSLLLSRPSDLVKLLLRSLLGCLRSLRLSLSGYWP